MQQTLGTDFRQIIEPLYAQYLQENPEVAITDLDPEGRFPTLLAANDKQIDGFVADLFSSVAGGRRVEKMPDVLAELLNVNRHADLGAQISSHMQRRSKEVYDQITNPDRHEDGQFRHVSSTIATGSSSKFKEQFNRGVPYWETVLGNYSEQDDIRRLVKMLRDSLLSPR